MINIDDFWGDYTPKGYVDNTGQPRLYRATLPHEPISSAQWNHMWDVGDDLREAEAFYAEQVALMGARSPA